ncbi:MAG TPA: hypothetical protein VML58_11660 [Burkholderiaceae bacterium]|nr:hypothetical protein [Burkholderiaceae bacterium]
MKWLLSMALALVGAGAFACPADDVKDAQANVQDKPVVQAKATATPAKAVVSSKKAQPTKVADKPATVAAAKPSL